MDDPVGTYWEVKLGLCAKALEKNNFQVFVAKGFRDARAIFEERILDRTSVKTASWGDSMTLQATGALDVLRKNPEIDFIETFDSRLTWEERYERRRRALLTDLFLTGTNALTETGKLVNLDMVGNRVGGITFGPKKVGIFVGRNKIVPDVAAAMSRIKNHAAPANAIRHPHLKTPCQKTGRCMDCKSKDRICSTWTICERSYPPGRIAVVLINADAGL